MFKKLHKFLLFGDSITRRSFDQQFGFGLAPALAHDYSCKLDVVVRGFGGYSSEMVKYVLPTILEQENQPDSQIKLMTVFLGTNDAVASGSSSASISQYQENLKGMIGLIQAKKIKVIIVGPALHQVVEENDPRSSALNRDYSQAAETVCKQLSVPFVNLWNAFAKDVGFDLSSEGIIPPGDRGSEISDLSKLLCDGIHFHSRGYELWYNELKKCIKENYPELDSESIPHLYPPIEKVDPNDIEGSIVNWDAGFEFKE